MNETRYLVDNNALAAITSNRIRSQFFRDYCQVTSDVLSEAEGHPDAEILGENVVDVTPEILETIREVMRNVGVGDTGLVDLYKNKGAADPGLIATMLELVAAEDSMLLGDKWVLVTNDHSVLAKATEFGIVAVDPPELAALIDSAS